MKYPNITTGKFLSRPNRFIAHVLIDGKKETVHVKNTGRCKELLVDGAEVYCVRSDNSERKTAYDLVAVKKGERIINMDSQAPNHVFSEFVLSGGFIGATDFVKPEYKWGNSRFDFFINKDGRNILVEVKGVTLESDGACYFPDAPTERGVKHINELISATSQGFETYLFFVIQMKNVSFFSPNKLTHTEFCDALKMAGERGVNILAYDCVVDTDSIEINERVPVIL